MNIVIVEHVIGEQGYSTISLNSTFKTSWDKGLEEYEISSEIIEKLKEKGVIGWMNGENRFGDNVNRTYMLIEEV